MTTKSVMKVASLILLERKLETQLRETREARRALGKKTGSSGLGISPDRHDLTISIGLADYLTIFEEKDVKPVARTYESEEYDPIENGQPVIKARGTRHYLHYPAQFVGTLPTKPQTHVWAEAQTEAVWAPGDPKPVLKPVAVEAQAAA